MAPSNPETPACCVYLTQDRSGTWNVALDAGAPRGGATHRMSSGNYDEAFRHALDIAARLGCDLMIQDARGSRLMTPQEVATVRGGEPL